MNKCQSALTERDTQMDTWHHKHCWGQQRQRSLQVFSTLKAISSFQADPPPPPSSNTLIFLCARLNCHPTDLGLCQIVKAPGYGNLWAVLTLGDCVCRVSDPLIHQRQAISSLSSHTNTTEEEGKFSGKQQQPLFLRYHQLLPFKTAELGHLPDLPHFLHHKSQDVDEWLQETVTTRKWREQG